MDRRSSSRSSRVYRSGGTPCFATKPMKSASGVWHNTAARAASKQGYKQPICHLRTRVAQALTACVNVLQQRSRGYTLALPVDGIEFAGQTLIIALGVEENGTKHVHVLGLWQGATENATAVKALLR